MNTWVYKNRLTGDQIDAFQDDMIANYSTFTGLQDFLSDHNLKIKRNFVSYDSNGLVVKLDTEYTDYSNKVNGNNWDQSCDDMSSKGADSVRPFMRKYMLDVLGAYLDCSTPGKVSIRFYTEYALEDGTKPWQEDSFRDDLERYMRGSDDAEVKAFGGNLPAGNLIGRTVKIPSLYKSKKKQAQTYKILGWDSSDKFPLKIFCNETQRRMAAAFRWDMTFID